MEMVQKPIRDIAVLITCYNRKAKTLSCLDALQETLLPQGNRIHVRVFLTDDGCTDGTADAIRQRGYRIPITILQGTGSLYWNGGMILAWKAALAEGCFDGFLWLNDDTTVLPAFWDDLLLTDRHSQVAYGRKGIYVGSTKDALTDQFTYGGFRYINKWTLVDQFIIPDGRTVQACEAAHGNITYVSAEVVEEMGIFCERYFHGGSDHDYTYLAHKEGFPVLVLPRYSAACVNDHLGKTRDDTRLPLSRRWKDFRSPKGAMHNTLLFNKRCFPWRVPFVWVSGLLKTLFPSLGYGLYLQLRRAVLRRKH